MLALLDTRHSRFLPAGLGTGLSYRTMARVFKTEGIRGGGEDRVSSCTQAPAGEIRRQSRDVDLLQVTQSTGSGAWLPGPTPDFLAGGSSWP